MDRARVSTQRSSSTWMQPLTGFVCTVVAVFLALSLHGCGNTEKPTPESCSEVGTDCTKTKCCVDANMKCFQKDDYWSACKTTCTPGIDPNDPPGMQSNWTCQELKPGVEPTTPTTTQNPDVPEGWTGGTWTTGYWDCCKPSCAWEGKGKLKTPVRSCDIETGEFLNDSNVKSVCNGGKSAACVDNAPFVVNDGLSMGFAAAAVGGIAGLTGDTNCGQCFELKFVDQKHADGNWGGAHPDLVDKRMIVQVTNIGQDVKGTHSFDIQVPGAGQGIFDTGCVAQFPDFETDDFDNGKRYGGMGKKSQCERLPEKLQDGCKWHFDWYKWASEGGQTNNPYVIFHRVKCPHKLTEISGAVPSDDDEFDVIV